MPSRKQLIDEMAAIAVKMEDWIGYPPQLIMAQWAVESAWGTRHSGKNNVFGMTRASRHRDKWEWVPTREVLTQKGIDGLSKDEAATITSKVLRQDWLYDVRLSRKFASYDTLEDAVRDKVTLITTNHRYRPHWLNFLRNKDVNLFMDAIAASGYATDPGYAKLLKQVANQKNIKEAIDKARLG